MHQYTKANSGPRVLNMLYLLETLSLPTHRITSALSPRATQAKDEVPSYATKLYIVDVECCLQLATPRSPTDR